MSFRIAGYSSTLWPLIGPWTANLQSGEPEPQAFGLKYREMPPISSLRPDFMPFLTSRRLLHSWAAFGIALRVAGACAANLSDAGVAQW